MRTLILFYLVFISLGVSANFPPSSEFSVFKKEELNFEFNNNNPAKCIRYTKMRKIGIGLLGGGGGATAAGIGMIVGGVYSEDGLPRAALITAGASFVASGFFMLMAGTPLTIVGSIARKKHCGSSTTQVKFGTNRDGLGLTLSF